MSEPDEALAQALTAILPNLPAQDYYFAEGLLRSYRRYQSFTGSQRPFVEQLVNSLKVLELPIPPANILQFPNLCTLIHPERFSHFRVGLFYFSLKRDGSVIWVSYSDTLHGMINTNTKVFRSLPRGLTPDQIDEANITLLEIEADPQKAAKADGILTGRCSCCGRTLTDSLSIQIGVGPICLKRAGW